MFHCIIIVVKWSDTVNFSLVGRVSPRRWHGVVRTLSDVHIYGELGKRSGDWRGDKNILVFPVPTPLQNPMKNVDLIQLF